MPQKRVNWICTVEGCERKARSRGWCDAHYFLWRKYGDPTIKKPPGCPKGETHPTYRHGHATTNSLTYHSWRAMKDRCLNPNCSDYWYYGARGVVVCERWRDSFENFLADMGERPRGTTLDRIDGTRGYEPGNCRWATPKEQKANQRTSHLVSYEGRTLPLVTWAEIIGIARATLYARIFKAGWAVQKAFNTPPRPKYWKGLRRELRND